MAMYHIPASPVSSTQIGQLTGGRHEYSGGSSKTLLMEARRRFVLAEKGSRANARCGSGTDLRRHHQEGLLLGVKRTYFAKKRTSASECPLLYRGLGQGPF